MISKKREKDLSDLERTIGVSFISKALLNQSLTHSSFVHESHEKIGDNERLEFLGDAVLKLVVSEYLYHKFPGKEEGDLTKIRASAISDATLAAIAQKMKLGSFLLLGENEKKDERANFVLNDNIYLWIMDWDSFSVIKGFEKNSCFALGAFSSLAKEINFSF